VLFDVDGTLVDSNYLHVRAWSLAFAEVGQAVDQWQIHRSIGMDSDKLLATCLGDAAGEVGEKASTLHADHCRDLGSELRAFDSARRLVRHLSRSGLSVVLATSAPNDELEMLRRVLDVDPWLTAVTSADDADTAKPDPDILHVALDKASVEAGEAIFIGDTEWDGRAAEAAAL
jgi:HAD superfamily hydrolase (TIGR01549 family)